MEAALLSGLYCIAFILHIYYIINFLFFQQTLLSRTSFLMVSGVGFEPTMDICRGIKSPLYSPLYDPLK